MSQKLLKWIARKTVQTKVKGILDCFDVSKELLANQSNTGHIANKAAVATNVIKALQQKASQLKIV